LDLDFETYNKHVRWKKLSSYFLPGCLSCLP
jgi:hypothetical protein